MRRRPIVVALLAGVLLLVLPSAAQACSCVGFENPEDQARSVLGYSDAAFIGSLVSVRELGAETEPGQPGLPPDAIFRFRVRSSFGSNLGSFVRVRSSTESAACGLGQTEGRKIALGLSGRQGAWRSGSCSYMDPSSLRKVAKPWSCRRIGPRGRRLPALALAPHGPALNPPCALT